MGVQTTNILGAIIIGVGATLIMDLWALFLKSAFDIPSLSYCLVGRWFLHMPEGTFTHTNIAAAQRNRLECAIGWIAHYAIGVVLAILLIVIVSGRWLTNPTLLPALFFGIGTVLFPFLILQPSLGFGVAASSTPNPMKARLKSLTTHIVFGLGLYVSAFGVNYVLRFHG